MAVNLGQISESLRRFFDQGQFVPRPSQHFQQNLAVTALVLGRCSADAGPMAAERPFSFAHLPRAAQRHIRLFQIHQFLDRFAMGLTVAIVALALADRGMVLFQITLLFGIYAVTTMMMELPFGGLADRIGRKPVFLAAVIASLVSLALFLSTRNFYVLALSFACIGFGRALRSGTLDAWFVETFTKAAPMVDIQPALAKAQWAGAMGLAGGAVLGGVLPDALGPVATQLGLRAYDVSYLMSFAIMLVVFAFTVLVIVEPPRPRTPGALRQSFGAVPHGIRDVGRLALTHPVVLPLLATLGLFLLATNPVEVLWPTLAKPMLTVDYANTAIGALTAGYFFGIAFGAFLSPYVAQVFGRQHAKTLAAVFVCLAAMQIALAGQSHIGGFAACFIVYSVLLGLSETPASSLLHRCVADHQRATLLSLRSLIQQLGAALGLVLAGALAQAYSANVAWGIGALFLGAAALLTRALHRRLNV